MKKNRDGTWRHVTTKVLLQYIPQFFKKKLKNTRFCYFFKVYIIILKFFISKNKLNVLKFDQQYLEIITLENVFSELNV
jgi:hypothetical protein